MGVLPFFHVFAMTAVMNFAIARGMEMILVPRFELIGTLKLISKLRPKMMPGVPTLFTAMMQAPASRQMRSLRRSNSASPAARRCRSR